MKHRFITLTILCSFLFLAFSSSAWSQQRDEDIPPLEMYGLGDQMLTITGGLFIPLFFSGDGIQSTNLSLGGVGSIRWETFLSNNLAVGAEVGGSFAFSPNQRTLLMLPLTARVAWFFRSYPWEFPVFLGAGMAFVKLDDMIHLDFILKPGASVYWNFNADWAFGLNLEYWFVPQIYWGDEPPRSQSRIGHFMDVTLSAIYHF